MSTLSVVTICQDEEEPIKWYLESCKHLSSVLKDNLKEIVLIDGGSKDSTIEVIKKYQKEISQLILLERPWDYTAAQQNFGLSYCTGDFIFTPDADMTWTVNFPEIFLSGYFESANYWDFHMLFTARDAYHFFHKWNRGINMRLHKRGPKWIRKYHVKLEGQTQGIPVCKDVVIFENSCRIKNDAALKHRGERRQSCKDDMIKEGASPGPSNRFYNAAHSPDSEIAHINTYNQKIADLILSTTNG